VDYTEHLYRSMRGPDAVARGNPPSSDRYWKIIARLNELMRALPTSPLYTVDLARRIGTSPRTLQTAAKRTQGMRYASVD